MRLPETSLSATAFAPATSANLGCGFDILGLALDGLGDTVTATSIPNFLGVRIGSISGDGGKLPVDPEKNTAAIAVLSLLSRTNSEIGIELTIEKGLPLGSGLGSSAASAVAALVAVNSLLEKPVDTSELLECALDAEEVACGSRHADNVAPCLYGGLTLVTSFNPVVVLSLPTPDPIYCVLFTPMIEVSTKSARALLPQHIVFRSAVIQAQKAAAFVAACYENSAEAALNSMSDLLAEPARCYSIPHFNALKVAAVNAGALSFNISGSGSTLLACCTSENSADEIEKAMAKVYSKAGLGYSLHSSRPCELGARLLNH
jgi:homoserine kinase